MGLQMEKIHDQGRSIGGGDCARADECIEPTATGWKG
jgi:hypothetical protein